MATYDFAQLSADQFQQLCQTLLTVEYPGVQCYPVNQGDGGRDATAMITDEVGEIGFICFQVKHTSKPAEIKDPKRWILSKIREELLSIKTLKKRGLKKYILMCNVRGSSRLDKGDIDTVAQFLTYSLELPAQCMWQNDLDRRLDKCDSLKWQYPQILRGTDVLAALVSSKLKRSPDLAIKQFLAYQYKADRAVKFKQIDLTAELVDLFLDIPCKFGVPDESDSTENLRRCLSRLLKGIQSNDDEHVGKSSALRNIELMQMRKGQMIELPETALALLDHDFQKLYPKLVLEGAPGQGKSTIAQFICQVNRMRWLGKSDDLKLVNAVYTKTAVRLPFKVDLRDFALWLAKRDPFDVHSTIDSTNWMPSLEFFLARQIVFQSGGVQFTVEDLHAVIRDCAILIVLDGLDEVAELSLRRQLIEAIDDGASRIRDSCSSLHLVITSRPAAFANAPGFDTKEYTHVTLGVVSPKKAVIYAKRWTNSRGMPQREALELVDILKRKLEEAHVREIARNPMQLAILLHLIQRRGAALPDKRTAVYDSYVDLFLDRESEKSEFVRDHRQLIVDIHMYLAWILHREAEARGEAGRINKERMVDMLAKFLRDDGHPAAIVEKLFAGVVERVVAIVSRIEGTYEFEVQPLREYFVARYLYNTAPYSPPGHERKWTKPDRFKLIAGNRYWLNVTRFYAGCFSSGELSGLADLLQELLTTAPLSRTSYPRDLMKYLLNDWVFSQQPRVTRRVIEALLSDDELVLTLLSSHFDPPSRNGAIRFSDKAARDFVFVQAFERLKTCENWAAVVLLTDIVAMNVTSEHQLGSRWLEHLASTSGEHRIRWWRIGVALEIFERHYTMWEAACITLDSSVEDLALGVAAGGHRQFNASSPHFGAVLNWFLNSVEFYSIEFGVSDCPVSQVLSGISELAFTGQWKRFRATGDAEAEGPDFERPVKASFLFPRSTEWRQHDIGQFNDFIESTERAVSRSIREWRQSPDAVTSILSAASRCGLIGWKLHCLAFAVGGWIDDVWCDATRLPAHLDACGDPLTEVLYARGVGLRVADLDRAAPMHANVAIRFLVLACTWSDVSELIRLGQHGLGDLTARLSDEDWGRVVMGVGAGRSGREERQDLDFSAVDAVYGERWGYLLALRMNDVNIHLFVDSLCQIDSEIDRRVAEFGLQRSLHAAMQGLRTWELSLDRIAKFFLHCGDSSVHAHEFSRERGIQMPVDIAERVLSRPGAFPLVLVNAANRVMLDWIGEQTSPVMDICPSSFAEEENADPFSFST